MMKIIGRITKDATIQTTKDDRQVANFNVAVNDYYKTPQGETVEHTIYFACAYWIRPQIAEKLKKGSVVEVDARLSLNTWFDLDGNARATIQAHVNYIKRHTPGTMLKEHLQPNSKEMEATDLPF